MFPLNLLMHNELKWKHLVYLVTFLQCLHHVPRMERTMVTCTHCTLHINSITHYCEDRMTDQLALHCYYSLGDVVFAHDFCVQLWYRIFLFYFVFIVRTSWNYEINRFICSCGTRALMFGSDTRRRTPNTCMRQLFRRFKEVNGRCAIRDNRKLIRRTSHQRR